MLAIFLISVTFVNLSGGKNSVQSIPNLNIFEASPPHSSLGPDPLKLGDRQWVCSLSSSVHPIPAPCLAPPRSWPREGGLKENRKGLVPEPGCSVSLRLPYNLRQRRHPTTGPFVGCMNGGFRSSQGPPLTQAVCAALAGLSVPH